MTEKEFQDALQAALQEIVWIGQAQDDHDDLPPGFEELAEASVRDVRTFQTAGVMTCNKGLVVRFADDSALQVTIVRSR